jgi:hypothetical protein
MGSCGMLNLQRLMLVKLSAIFGKAVIANWYLKRTYNYKLQSLELPFRLAIF